MRWSTEEVLDVLYMRVIRERRINVFLFYFKFIYVLT